MSAGLATPPTEVLARTGRARVRGGRRATAGRAQPRWRTAPSSTLAVWGGLGAIVAWRVLLLARTGSPIGVDMGNWLRLFRSWSGAVHVDDVLVPPLVPLITGLADLAVGPLWASWLVPAGASVAPAVGVWLVASRRASRPVAAIAALTLALVHPTATAFAWGGVPQLVGLGLAPVALWLTVRALHAPSRRTWSQAALAAAAVALTSTLVTVLLGLALAVAVTLALAQRGARVLRGVGWALLVAAPAVALYVPILLRMSLYEQRSTGVVGSVALRSTVGGPIGLWVVLLALSAVVPFVLRAGRDRTFHAALIVAAVAGLWLGDVRFAALIPTAVVLAATALLGREVRGVGGGGVGVGAGVAGLAGVGVAGGGGAGVGGGVLRRFSALQTAGVVALGGLVVVGGVGVAGQAAQIDFYAKLVPPGILADAALIATLDRGDMAVAVPPVSGAPTGWWLEAVGVDALVASRPDWLAFPEEREVAAQAVALFSDPSWPTPNTARAACALRAPWLYVPDVWRGVDTAALAREVDAGRLVEIARTPTARVLRSAAC